MNFKQEFKNYVIDYFMDEYLHGRTPNPCIACNHYVKWESLLKGAWRLEQTILLLDITPVSRGSVTGVTPCTSATSVKDQTYALYSLTQEQSERTLMPVGEYTKDEIRKAGWGNWPLMWRISRTARTSALCRMGTMLHI